MNIKSKQNRRILVAICSILVIINILCVAANAILYNPSLEQVKKEFKNLNPLAQIYDTLDEAIEAKAMITYEIEEFEEVDFNYSCRAEENIMVELYYEGEIIQLGVRKAKDFYVAGDDLFYCTAATLRQSGRYVFIVDYRGYILYIPMDVNFKCKLL